ncbi:hypothetical protein BJ085DRAFT_272, partial [Dimargaris cristalligena]
IEDIYPCLPVQEGLLFATLKDPAAYMVQLSVLIEGPLDPTLFQWVWEQTAQSQATFRTRFLMGTSQRPDLNLQVVATKFGAQWTTGDWQGQSIEKAEAEFTLHEREKGFPRHRPMIKFGLFQLAPQKYKYIVSAHHAILDGWSIGLMTQSIFGYYSGKVPPPTISFKEVVTHIKSQSVEKAAKFW